MAGVLMDCVRDFAETAPTLLDFSIIARGVNLVTPWSIGRSGGLVNINPFDGYGSFFVLVNDDEQHSLRPSFTDVAAGWPVVYGETDHAAWMDHIGEICTDVRSNSLREKLAADRAFNNSTRMGLGSL